MQFVEMKAYGMKISPQIFTRITSATLHLDALNATYFEKTFLQFTSHFVAINANYIHG